MCINIEACFRAISTRAVSSGNHVFYLVKWMDGGLLLLMLSAHHLVLLSTVRKGYRIQADKERDSMKVLYYVEKELAQFDPARRMRGRCEHLLVLCDLCIARGFIAWG